MVGLEARERFGVVLRRPARSEVAALWRLSGTPYRSGSNHSTTRASHRQRVA